MKTRWQASIRREKREKTRTSRRRREDATKPMGKMRQKSASHQVRAWGSRSRKPVNCSSRVSRFQRGSRSQGGAEGEQSRVCADPTTRTTLVVHNQLGPLWWSITIVFRTSSPVWFVFFLFSLVVNFNSWLINWLDEECTEKAENSTGTRAGVQSSAGSPPGPGNDQGSPSDAPTHAK